MSEPAFSTTASTAYIGVGSNLLNPVTQVSQAIGLLADLSVGDFKASSLYASPPMGPADQPDYINAVVHLETDLAPLALLDRLQTIENQQGRIRERRWGARTLDLDLLLYSDEQINHERLVIPHPGIPDRDFVLLPLQEVSPSLIVPGLGALAHMVEKCAMKGAHKL